MNRNAILVGWLLAAFFCWWRSNLLGVELLKGGRSHWYFDECDALQVMRLMCHENVKKCHCTCIKTLEKLLFFEGVYQTLTRHSIRIESRETKGSRIRTRSRIRGILSVSLILGLD